MLLASFCFVLTQANFLFLWLMPAGSDSPFWVPIWFSNGIAPLLVRKFGKAAMAGIIIASYTTETFVMDMPVMNAAVIALANGLQAGLVYRLLVRLTGPDLRIGDSPGAVVRFLAVTLIVSVGISSPIGTLAFEGWHSPQSLITWTRWTLGDMTAFVIVTPFCRFLLSRETTPLSRSLGEISLALALAVLVFCDWSRAIGLPFVPISFVLFPAITLLAVHAGRRATATVTFGVGLIAAGMTAAGFGPFAAWAEPSINIFLLQGFLIALGVSGLLLAALTHDRGVAHKRVQATLRYLDRLVDERTEELHQANQRLHRVICYDGLTKCYSRQGFIETVEALPDGGEPDRGNRYLLYIDLDGFKAVNDTHGHRQGDALLAELAERFLSVSGKHAVVARIGGDEFVVASEHLFSRQEATALAARLIGACRHTRNLRDSPVEISASIGITVLNIREAGSITELLDRADTAMYSAKRSGRGSIRWVDEGPAGDLSAAMI